MPLQRDYGGAHAQGRKKEGEREAHKHAIGRGTANRERKDNASPKFSVQACLQNVGAHVCARGWWFAHGAAEDSG